MPTEQNQDTWQPPEAPVPGPTLRRPEPAASQPASVPVEQLGKTLEALESRMTNVQQAAQQDNLATRLLSDPLIKDYVLRLSRGEQPTSIGGPQQSQAQPEPEEPPADLDSMPAAQLVGYLEKKLSRGFEATLNKIVDDRLSAFEGKIKPALDTTLADVQARQQQDINREIEEASKEFKDFDAMRPAMAKLSRESGGSLKIKELYYLAKFRSGTPMIPQRELETERPTNVPQDRRKWEVPDNARKGRTGFDSLVAAALENEAGPFTNQ